MSDEIFVFAPDGKQTAGPIKASVQGNKVLILDETLVIEEGGRILRPLPNGKAESHAILQVDLHSDPSGRLSHFEVITRKESSLVATPSRNTFNISHSQGFQIGDGNVQNIIGSLDTLVRSIESSSATPLEKASAKEKLKSFLSHPATLAVLGSAVSALLGKL